MAPSGRGEVLMSKFNIYKLIESNYPALLQKLEQVGLRPEKTHSVNNYEMTLYFSVSGDEKDVPWIYLYQDFFISDPKEIKNISYFGVVLIKTSKYLYAISLGKSHFYLQDFCYLDFGIDLGLRIINQKSVQTKNSKLFGMRRKKSLIVYRAETEIDVESGESVVYLKGKSIDSNKWGKNIICGNSVQLSIKDYKATSLPILVENIESELQKPPLFEIPRAEVIKSKERIRELDNALVVKMKNVATEIEVEEQSLSGVEFIFAKDFQLSLKTDSFSWIALNEQSIFAIISILSEENFEINAENINDVKIRAQPEEGAGFTKNIKYFLDYVDEDYNFLHGGKWYCFNRRYVDYLHSEIEKFTIDHFNEFTFNRTEYEAFKKTIPIDQCKNWYPEKYFNSIVASKFQYINLDVESTQQIYQSYKLEVGDLLKDETLYFVKIGNAQKQNYVVDQATGTLKFLIDNKRTFSFNNSLYMPKKLCLWMILDRKTAITALKQLRSFILLINIMDWKKDALLNEYEPLIRISYVA
jgi:uncharacterized protein (TIGR04141 family)